MRKDLAEKAAKQQEAVRNQKPKRLFGVRVFSFKTIVLPRQENSNGTCQSTVYLVTSHDDFAKTGSGQTYGNSKTNGRVLAGAPC